MGSVPATNSKHHLTRRRVLRLLAGVSALGPIAACAGCATPAPAPGASTPSTTPVPAQAAGQSGGSFDWLRFKGDSINVEISASPRADMLRKYQPEFEALTGMRVNLEITPEQQARQKQVIQFQSGTTDFDVTFVSWHVQKRLFGKGKWTEDLLPYLTDRTRTPADFDFEDFSRTGIEHATQADGRMDTMPVTVEVWLLYWHKELFEQAGLKPPDSHEDLYQAGRKLTDASSKTYGFIGRGLKNANVPIWTQFLLGYDLDAVDRKTHKLNTDGPEAIEAARLYQRLMRECAPPTVAGYNWNECQTSFMQGSIGMWLDALGYSAPLANPSKSRVAGKVGYGLVPRGPKARLAADGGDGVGISSFSRKKDQAYLYLLWAAGKANQVRLLLEAGSNPVRTSAFRDPAVTAPGAFQSGFLDCVVGSAAIGRLGLPEIIPVTEFRDTFGIALANIIGGADPAAELRQATEDFRPILEQSER